MAQGIDPRTMPMPVAPAAHYHMGGIKTDIFGRTSLKGLYAVGECACTGVHGANRLASNSLLEAAAFGERVGKAAIAGLSKGFTPDTTHATRPAPPPSLSENDLQTLRDAMSHHAGVVRDEAGLTRLLDLITGLDARYPGALALVSARLIATCALHRRESRGSHYRSDYPHTDAAGARTFTNWPQVYSAGQNKIYGELSTCTSPDCLTS
jgi:L-aspartate oxidase